MSAHLDIAKEAYAAFGRGDIAAILPVISEQVEWRVVGPDTLPFPTLSKTRDEVANYFKQLTEAEEITAFEPREFIDGGDKIVVLGFVAATVRETKKSFETEWAHVITMKDGMVTRFIEFFDTAAHPTT
ncbi:nuclear transport factor 2 family protein [Caballeronia sp.]|uniref:nuclear transport factor 2 family protein n=1 Tax=Caballeronia sp. TaxID=1931223 RepID=UPI003C391BD7